MLMRLAVEAEAEVLVSIQSPAASAVVVICTAQVVAPSIPEPEPAALAQARPPEAAVANEALRAVGVPALFLATTTAGVPASAATVISTTWEAAGMKHCRP